MRRHNLRSGTFLLALAALSVLVVATIACDGNGDGGDSDTPGATPRPTSVVTPGVGATPIQAVGTYINVNGLDGNDLNTGIQADCPLNEPPEPGETPTPDPLPGVSSRASLGQFCLTPRDLQAETSVVVAVELTTTGEVWDMFLRFKSDDRMWEVSDVQKVSDGTEP